MMHLSRWPDGRRLSPHLNLPLYDVRAVRCPLMDCRSVEPQDLPPVSSQHPVSLAVSLAAFPLVVRGAVRLDSHPSLGEGEVDEVSFNAELGRRGEALATHGLVEFQLNRRHPYVAGRSRYLDRLGSRRRFTLNPAVVGLAVDRPDNRLGCHPERATEQVVEESHVKSGYGQQSR